MTLLQKGRKTGFLIRITLDGVRHSAEKPGFCSGVVLMAIILLAGLGRVHAAPMPQAAPTVLAVAASGGANLYQVPGGPAEKRLPQGSVMTALGRDAAGEWVQVRTGDDGVGWVAASQLFIVDLANLPVISPAVSTVAGSGESAPPKVSASPETETTPSSSQPAPTSNLSVQRTGVVGIAGGAVLDGPNGSVLRQLPPGSMLTVLSQTQSGAWLQVQDLNGNAGWIRGEQVLMAPLSDSVVADDSTAESIASQNEMTATLPLSTTQTAQPLVTIRTRGQRLNLRSGPGPAYASVGMAINGQIYSLLGQDESGAWLQVQLPDTLESAWVSASYATITDAAGTELPLTSTKVVIQSLSNPENGMQSGGLAKADIQLPGQILFQTNSGGSIYLLDAKGSNLRILGSGLDPVLAPDGDSVLAAQQFDDHWEIVAMDANGSRLTRLTENESSQNSLSPAWSPDGNWILFFTDRAGKWQPWIMAANGADPQPLAPEVLAEFGFQINIGFAYGVDWR